MTKSSSDLSNQNKKIRKKRKRSNQVNINTSSELTNKPLILKKKRRKRKKRPDNSVEKISLIETNEKTTDKTTVVPLGLKPDSHDTMNEMDVKKGDQNRNWKRVFFLVFFLIAVFLLILFSCRQLSQIKVPNFVDKSITDVTKWADENGVKVDIKKVYSSTVKSDDVLKQDPAMNESMKKGSRLKVTISQELDPEEYIKLPDFSTMNEKQVKEFVKKNKIENITIRNEYSETVAKGNVIKVEFDDKKVTAETYQRKDGLTIYLSMGEKIEDNQVLIPDFSNKTKEEVDEWANKNNIFITYEEVDSEKPKGSVISMSSTEQYIPKKAHITVGISNGRLDKQAKDAQSESQETTDSTRMEIKGKG